MGPRLRPARTLAGGRTHHRVGRFSRREAATIRLRARRRRREDRSRCGSAHALDARRERTRGAPPTRNSSALAARCAPDRTGAKLEAGGAPRRFISFLRAWIDCDQRQAPRRVYGFAISRVDGNFREGLMSAEVVEPGQAMIHKDVRALAPAPNLLDYETDVPGIQLGTGAFASGGLAGRPRIEHRARGGGPPRDGVDGAAHGVALARKIRREAGHQLSGIVADHQPLRQCAARARRRRGRTRVHLARTRARALRLLARRAQGQMRRLAAVFRVRAGADRHASRTGRGSGPRHHASSVSSQGGGDARATAETRPCLADRRRRNGARYAVLAAPDRGSLRGIRDSADFPRGHGAHSFHQRNHRSTEGRRARPRGDRHALRDRALCAGSPRRRTSSGAPRTPAG